jgi:hypothetical protein
MKTKRKKGTEMAIIESLKPEDKKNGMTVMVVVSILILLVIIGAFYSSHRERKYYERAINQKDAGQSSTETVPANEETNQNISSNSTFSDAFNTVYLYNGEEISIKNGKAEMLSEGSTSRTLFQIWGSPVKEDVNGDAVEDQITVISIESTGEDILYYLGIALGNENKYYGTNLSFIGSGISIQNIEFAKSYITLNYMQPSPNESVIQSSDVLSKFYIVEGYTLREVLDSVIDVDIDDDAKQSIPLDSDEININEITAR